MNNTTRIRPEWPDDELIRKYLSRTATTEEESRIEMRLLDDPDFLEHIERELALREGLAALPEPISEPRRYSPPSTLPTKSLPRRTSNRRWQWATAAAFVLAVGLIAALATLKRSIDERDTLSMRIALLDAPIANVPIVPVSIMRGAAAATALPRSPVVLRVYLPETASASEPRKYQVTISRDGAGGEDGAERPAFDISDLVAMDDGSLSIALNATALVPGSYALVVREQAAEGKSEVMRVMLSAR